MTNAVKHLNTKCAARRLHKKPKTREIERCRWWYGQERALVHPAASSRLD